MENKNTNKRVERIKENNTRERKKEDQTSRLSLRYKMVSLFLLTVFFSGHYVQLGNISWYQE